METVGRQTEDLTEVFCEFLEGINKIIEKIQCNDFLFEFVEKSIYKSRKITFTCK